MDTDDLGQNPSKKLNIAVIASLVFLLASLVVYLLPNDVFGIGRRTVSVGSEKKPVGDTGYFVDPRDGNRYRTVVIGKIKWMADALRYTAGGKIGSCPDGDPECLRRRLYTWSEALGLNRTFDYLRSGLDDTKVFRGICPEGWRIPHPMDVKNLIQSAGADIDASVHMDTAVPGDIVLSSIEAGRNLIGRIGKVGRATFGFSDSSASLWTSWVTYYPEIQPEDVDSVYRGMLYWENRVELRFTHQYAFAASIDSQRAEMTPASKTDQNEVRCVSEVGHDGIAKPEIIPNEDQAGVHPLLQELLRQANVEPSQARLQQSVDGFMRNTSTGVWVRAVAVSMAVDLSDPTVTGNSNLSEEIQALAVRTGGIWRVIASRRGSEHYELEDIDLAHQAIHVSKAVYGPDDPRCCPSYSKGYYLVPGMFSSLVAVPDEFPMEKR